MCGLRLAEKGEDGEESAAVCHRRDRGVGSHPCHDLCVRPRVVAQTSYTLGPPPLARPAPGTLSSRSGGVAARCPLAVAVAQTVGPGG